MQGLECVAKLWELTDILKRTSACAAAQDHGVDNEIRYCFKGPIANSHLKSLANCVVPESSREFDAVVFVSTWRRICVYLQMIVARFGVKVKES